MSGDVAVLTAAEQDRLADAEQIIERGLSTFVDVGRALAEVRDSRLYRQDFGTFEAYCEKRWGLARTRAYELISAASITERVSEISDMRPANEGQAKQLRDLDPGVAADVMRDAHEQTAGRVTAEAIREARERRGEIPHVKIRPDSLGHQRPAVSVTEWVESDQKVVDARYIHSFQQVVHQATQLGTFDPERLGRILDQDHVNGLDDLEGLVRAFAAKLRKAHSSLRVVQGGRR